MSFGAGVSFPLGRGWKFDVFAYYAPNRVDNGSNGNEEWIHAAGVGVGVHYTMENGFTVGFKAPILGYSADVGTVGSTSTGAGVGNYYLASACGLPLFFLGYRL
jgi:hypothetical protein